MKRTLLIGCFLIAALMGNAQRLYFIYLQTDSGDPFFVRMNDKLYSSTSSGYLILSRLLDSTYSFKLGFPGKNVELDFSMVINKKDHGFLVKDFGDKGWGLFDLQSMGIQMSTSNVKGTARLNTDSNLRVNAFTDMLSRATDDPSLKLNAVFVKEETKQPEVVQTVQTGEKKSEATEALVKENKKPEVVSQPVTRVDGSKKKSVDTVLQQENTSVRVPDVAVVEVYKKSHVTKLSGVSTIQGFESVFIDQYQNGMMDTVRILIPGENKEVPREVELADTTTHSQSPIDTSQAVVLPQPEKKKEPEKKRGLFSPGKNSNSDNKTASQTPKKEIKLFSFFNKSKQDTTEGKICQLVANQDDFLKLRRKMASKTNDEAMLDEARKYFKIKCFTTEQVKNLSSMFLSNAGKYNFFTVAKGRVSDPGSFSTLESELKDAYYVNEFRDLLRN